MTIHFARCIVAEVAAEGLHVAYWQLQVAGRHLDALGHGVHDARFEQHSVDAIMQFRADFVGNGFLHEGIEEQRLTQSDDIGSR